jgi:hypothetical protein
MKRGSPLKDILTKEGQTTLQSFFLSCTATTPSFTVKPRSFYSSLSILSHSLFRKNNRFLPPNYPRQAQKSTMAEPTPKTTIVGVDTTIRPHNSAPPSGLSEASSPILVATRSGTPCRGQPSALIGRPSPMSSSQSFSSPLVLPTSQLFPAGFPMNDMIMSMFVVLTRLRKCLRSWGIYERTAI